jgi:hypothetical protein
MNQSLRSKQKESGAARFLPFVTCVSVAAVMLGLTADANAKQIPQPRVATSPAGFETVSFDTFPVMPWDSQPASKKWKNGVETIADCSFNLAGFVWREDLPACEQNGLAAIMLPKKRFKAHGWRNLSDADIDGWVKRFVDESGQSPAIAGYFIVDEPGAGDFPALGKAVAAMRKYAPGKLAYINLFPNYATLGAENLSQLETRSYEEYLERYVNEVRPQFISYDNYMVQFSMDLKKQKQTALYFTNLLDVRRVALKYGLPYWNIVSSNQIRPLTVIPSPANLLLQAYTTLAAGYGNLTWYTYYATGYGYAPISEKDEKTPTWRWLKEVNRQVAVLGPYMLRLTSTDVRFTSPAVADGLPTLPGTCVSALKSDSPIMVGEFRHEDGSEWVMAVNLSLERSANFTLTTVGESTISVVSTEDGRVMPYDPEKGYWLVAGQGALLRLDRSKRQE